MTSKMSNNQLSILFYQDEDYDESYDHGDETDAETFRHRTEVATTNRFNNNFYRYKSMRDHTGRWFLMVKIR